MVHHYLLIYPVEALIASNLDPVAFASYMATGSKDGSAEQLAFIELTGTGFADFDWAHAASECDEASRGRAKRSAYLGVYRVLERTPIEALGDCHLVTRDGRSLRLQRAEADEAACAVARPWMYQELTPATPLVVSSLNPYAFCRAITDPTQRVSLPALAFADMRMPSFDGDTGTVHYQHTDHLRGCIAALSAAKPTKTVDRTELGRLSYNNIATGVYVGRGEQVVRYAMPDTATLVADEQTYAWAKSANIV